MLTTPPALDLQGNNIAEMLHANGEKIPDKIAIATDKTDITYREFCGLSNSVASNLQRQGVKTGDRIVVRADKSAEVIALFFATLRLGAIYVPINPSLTKSELDVILNVATPHYFVQSDRLKTSYDVKGPKQLLLSDLTDNATDHEGTEIVNGGELPAVILFTSGTTGTPKGAILTHHNLWVTVTQLIEQWRFTEDDVLLHVLPIYHAHGLFLAASILLSVGAQIKLMEKFDVDRAIELLPDCSVLMAVPTIHSRLLQNDAFNQQVCSKLRLVTSGSAPLPLEVFDEFYARTSIQLLERYGSTESGMISSNLIDSEKCRGSVGVPFPGVKIRLVDNEGNDVADGKVGKLLVSSPYVGPGYWKGENRTDPIVYDEGYFDTGDMVYQNAEGYLFIVGRDKDLVISGGLNIYPREIEIAIASAEGVADVAVVGVPHPDFGETIIAIVVPKPDAHLSIDYLSDYLSRILTGYKRPRKIILSDSLPQTAIGKTIKRELQKQYENLFV